MNENVNEVYTDLEEQAAAKKSPYESEMERLEMEYHKGSLVAAILEVRIKIFELESRLRELTKPQDQEETKVRTIKR